MGKMIYKNVNCVGAGCGVLGVVAAGRERINPLTLLARLRVTPPPPLTDTTGLETWC